MIKKRNSVKADFFIVGAQKAGTTSLQYYLREHPDIYIPKEENPYFEDEDYCQKNLKEFEETLRVGNDRLKGIKRPMYLCEKNVARRIFKHNPKAKILVILRNPIDRAISAYFHQMRMGLIEPIDPNVGLKHILRYGHYKKYPKTKIILEYGLYFKHLKRYLKYFSDVKIILFDDLINNSGEVVSDCFSFLNVDASFVPKSLGAKLTKGEYSLKRLRFFRPRLKHMYTYKKKYYGLKAKKKTFLDRQVIKFYGYIDRVLVRHIFKPEKPDIDKEIKKQLFNFYKRDIKNLERLTNLDLSEWIG